MAHISEEIHSIEDRFNSQPKKKVEKLNLTTSEIDKVADYLESELHGGEESRAFYCKCAQYFPRGYIVGVVGKAKETGKDPNRYFVYLMRIQMDKKGIERNPR